MDGYIDIRLFPLLPVGLLSKKPGQFGKCFFTHAKFLAVAYRTWNVLQLFNAGFTTLARIAKADVGKLVKTIEHLSRKQATQITASAKVTGPHF